MGADCQAEIKRHEFQANYDRRSIQKISETIESQQEELHRAQRTSSTRSTTFSCTVIPAKLELREAHNKSLNETEELKKFQNSTFDTIARRRLVEDQDTILELTGKIQELQNEINCVNDSREFEDAESVRSGNSHVTSQPVFFPPHPIPGGMLRCSFGMLSRSEGPPSIWDTHGRFGKLVLQIQLRPLQHLIRRNWIHGVPEEKNWFTHQQWKRVRDKHKIKIWDAFSDLQWRTTTTADFGSPFWQVPYTSNLCLLEDKVQDRGMYLFTISYGSDAMDQGSGVGWFSGWFNGLRFLRGRQIAYLIYDQFRVTGANDSVENYADLFTISLRNDDIQEFEPKWDGNLLSMTKIPPDDILEGLFKLRTRESEKLKTVLELYDLEIHQKKKDLIITDWRQW